MKANMMLLLRSIFLLVSNLQFSCKVPLVSNSSVLFSFL